MYDYEDNDDGDDDDYDTRQNATRVLSLYSCSAKR